MLAASRCCSVDSYLHFAVKVFKRIALMGEQKRIMLRRYFPQRQDRKHILRNQFASLEPRFSRQPLGTTKNELQYW